MGTSLISGNTTKQISPNYGTDPAYRVSGTIVAASLPASGALGEILTFTLPASNANLARFKRVHLMTSGIATTTTGVQPVFQLVRRTAPSSGTAASTSVTPIPMDPANTSGGSGQAPTVIVKTWTSGSSVLTTNGASLVLETVTHNLAAVVVSDTNILFTNAGDQAPMLRGPVGNVGNIGTSDQFSLLFSSGVTTTGVVFSYTVEWEECPTAAVTVPDAG